MSRILKLFLSITVLLAAFGCNKVDKPNSGEETVIGNYYFDGVQYPIVTAVCLSAEPNVKLLFSPQKQDDKMSTYFIIGLNEAFLGQDIDIEDIYHNDDYLFIYEDPLYLYSQYWEIQSGKMRLSRTGESFSVSVDFKLADGKSFKMEMQDVRQPASN